MTQAALAPKRARGSRGPSRDADEVRVVGAPRVQLRDFYHAFLRAPWWAALLAIVAAYLSLNACFGVAYLLSGGIAVHEPRIPADYQAIRERASSTFTLEVLS